MNILEKILKKNPLELADDDHPERKDISKKQFVEALNLIAKKHKLTKTKTKKKTSEFSDALIDSLNSLD